MTVDPAMSAAALALFADSGDRARVSRRGVPSGPSTARSRRDFGRQYYGVYRHRLGRLRARLAAAAALRWPGSPVTALAGLGGAAAVVVVVGSVYKHQPLKPSILRELCEELQLVPEPERCPPRKNFVDDSDRLILEDELQRIRLVGNVMDVKKMVTGVVCAVLGFENEDGMFEVMDHCFVDLPIPKPISTLEDDKFVVIVSGLNISSSKSNGLSVQLFTDWLTGTVGSVAEQNMLCKVVKLIIAGNSIGDLNANPSTSDSAVINTFNASSPMFNSLEALKKLDTMLCRLCQSVEVDLMPGEFDPTNIMMPQNPMHYCMFPKASQLSSFKGVTNPYECEVEGRIISGTSGQPVDDILRYTTIESQMEALENTLKWGHKAPTAPDTLPCIPMFEEDPFVIEDCPHIYFNANTHEFDTKVYEGKENVKVRLVCVPSFAEKETIVLINLRNLDCYPMSFHIDSY